MPKCLKNYLSKVKAQKYRNRHRKLNYDLGNFSTGKRRLWRWRDCQIILDHQLLDRKLAEKLKRSVRAIQTKRSKLMEFEPNYLLRRTK